MMPVADEALSLIETFGREMQERQAAAGGLLRSGLGKARGQALRLGHRQLVRSVAECR